MTLRSLSSITAAAALAAVVYFAQPLARGQEAAPTKAKGKGKQRITGPVPRLADGKPDLSGVWGSDRPFVVDIGGALPKGESIPLND